jgi:hypothetical protein
MLESGGGNSAAVSFAAFVMVCPAFAALPSSRNPSISPSPCSRRSALVGVELTPRNVLPKTLRVTGQVSIQQNIDIHQRLGAVDNDETEQI